MKSKTKSYQLRGVTRELNMCRREELTWQNHSGCTKHSSGPSISLLASARPLCYGWESGGLNLQPHYLVGRKGRTCTLTVHLYKLMMSLVQSVWQSCLHKGIFCFGSFYNKHLKLPFHVLNETGDVMMTVTMRTMIMMSDKCFHYEMNTR